MKTRLQARLIVVSHHIGAIASVKMNLLPIKLQREVE
jgi:hypothetical protein